MGAKALESVSWFTEPFDSLLALMVVCLMLFNDAESCSLLGSGPECCDRAVGLL